MRTRGSLRGRGRIYSLGTTATAVLLTFGLLIMRVSVVEAYSGVLPIDSGVFTKPTSSLPADTNSVISYPLLPMAGYLGDHVDCAVEACIALTFDDGPDPTTTPQVLDALEHAHARATFFVIGSKVAANTALLNRMHASGDEVGNHSWSHPDFTKLSVREMQDQVALNQAAVVAAGLPAPRYFRPPYESRNPLVHQVVNMPFVLWNVDTKDWSQKSADAIVAGAVGPATDGSIIIMHDTKSLTAQALPRILEQLQARFHLVTVSELLKLPPGTQGEFFRR